MAALSTLALVCALTFLHYTAAQMRGPVLALYAAAHGATPAGVGLILGAHVAVAAAGSIPLGPAPRPVGRRLLPPAGNAGPGGGLAPPGRGRRPREPATPAPGGNRDHERQLSPPPAGAERADARDGLWSRWTRRGGVHAERYVGPGR